MSKKEKALAKFRQNPGNVRFEDLETVLLSLGFNERQGGTAHVVFTYRSWILTVPNHPGTLLKVIYVKKALRAIDEMTELDEE